MMPMFVFCFVQAFHCKILHKLMQVYYHTHDGLYPFGKVRQDNTRYFVEHLVAGLDSTQQQHLKTLTKKYKSISSPHLLNIYKMLKDQDQIHFIYEYYPRSISEYLKDNPKESKRLESELGQGLRCLEKEGFKAEIKVDNIGVDQKGMLKIFVCPECLKVGKGQDELSQFYSTEKYRIRLELEEIYEGASVKQENFEVKLQKNPGFVIRGNQLVFSKKQTSKSSTSQQEGNRSNLPKNIMSEIERQRQITQKLKNRRHKQSQKEQRSELQQKKYNNFPSLSSKDSENITEMKEYNRFSLDADPQGKKETLSTNRNSTGCHPYPNVHAKMDHRMISSATDTTNNEYYDQVVKQEERPTSSLKKESKSNFRNRQSQTEEELKAIARKNMESQGTEEEPKIHVTTEMVSKYKMKIVTCQEIEFQGKEGDDIQKLAHQKLLQYQAQHGYPQITAETEVADKNVGEQRQHRDQHGPNAELLAKISKAKEKANALKELARIKKK